MNPLTVFSLGVVRHLLADQSDRTGTFKVIYDQVIQTNAAGAVSYCISLQQT